MSITLFRRQGLWGKDPKRNDDDVPLGLNHTHHLVRFNGFETSDGYSIGSSVPQLATQFSRITIERLAAPYRVPNLTELLVSSSISGYPSAQWSLRPSAISHRVHTHHFTGARHQLRPKLGTTKFRRNEPTSSLLPIASTTNGSIPSFRFE